jgi:hypothetical protein
MRVEPSLLLIAGTMILGGAINIFFPREALEINKRIAPRIMFRLLEKSGFAQPMVVRITGYFGVLLGLAFACMAFLVPMGVFDMDRGSGTQPHDVKSSEKKSDIAR